MRRAFAALASLSVLACSAAAQDAAHLSEVASLLLRAHVPAADDPDARAHELVDGAARNQASATAALLIAEARLLAPTLRRPADCIAELRRLLAGAPHGLAASETKVMATELLVQTGELDAARDLRAFDDYASALIALGPFGDHGDDFGGVVFPCELEFPAEGAALAGRYGPVSPRVVKRRPLRSLIELAPEGERRVGCFYGLHQVVADADTSCYAEVTCPGSFELFVNGALIGGVDRNAEQVPIALRFGVTLRQGHNQVLVKTTHNGFSAFALRYVDASGRPVAALTEFADLPEVRPHGGPPAGIAPPGPFPDGLSVLVRAAQETGELTTTLAAGLTAFRARDHGVAMAMLHELEEHPPESSVEALAYTELLFDALPLPLEIRRGRARTVFDAVADAFPDHHQACLRRASFFEDQDQREEAVRLLEARVAAGVAGPETFDRLHRLLNALEFHAEARRLRALWREALPRDPRPVLLDAGERAAAGDARGALAMLQEMLQRAPLDTVRRRALDLAPDLGEADLAMRLVTELHRLDPDDVSAWVARADTARAVGRTDEAHELYLRIAAHADASGADVRHAGDALLRDGLEREARDAYERSLQIDPSQHDLRRSLLRLGDAQEEFPHLARFRRDGDAIIAAFQPGTREESASSSLLLDQLLVEVLPDGSMIEETHQIRRINDLRGVERYQEARAAATAKELVLLRTVAPDGKSYVPNRVEHSFSMPRLEPGACIEWVYRNYARAPGPEPMRGPVFHFRGADEPYLLSELVVILPAGHRGDFRVRNLPEKPEIIALDDGTEAHVYRRTDVPRLPEERSTPPLDELVPVVALGEDAAPGAVVRELWSEAAARGYVTPQVAQQTAHVVEGLQSDLEKAKAIHAFVHESIAEGGGPADPTAILTLRRGPRFFLEAAMLRLAGVPVRNAAAANAHEDFDTSAAPLFLGHDEYDVPALLIEPRDAAPVWLFADAPRHAPLGMVPYLRLGAAALVQEGPGAALVRIPRGTPEDEVGMVVRGTLALQTDGSATMEATGVLRGAVGLAAAEQLRTAEENVRQVVARQVAGRSFPGWALREASLDVREHGEPLALRAVLEKRRALEPAGAVLLMGLPLDKLAFLSSFGDRPTRTLPFRISDLLSSTWEITIDPGPGHRFLEIPSSVRVRNLLVDYNLTFRSDGDKVVVRRDVVIWPGTLATSEFANWLEVLHRLDQAEAAHLKLAVKR
jgi:tetratricopeptide (TPR) repeat protein